MIVRFQNSERDREGAEAVVAVEDPDDDAADPEQDQDREEDLGEGDRQVGGARLRSRGAKIGITTGARRTKRAVIAPSTMVTSSSRVEARRKASR